MSKPGAAKRKAKEILRIGTLEGKPLTKVEARYYHSVASGKSVRQ